MHTRRWLFVLLIAVLVLPTLAIAPFAGAQEGPPQVGLRPDAPPYALHGPYWVGLKDSAITFEYSDGTTRESRVSVWYPAQNPGGALQPYTYTPEQRVLDYSGTLYLPRTLTALLDAAPDMAAAPYPVVIFSHGGWAYRWHLPQYVENLASHGFVVIATDHQDAPPDWVMTGHKELTRQWDVRALIDYAGQITAADGVLPGVADMERVGVTGYSAGGFTALLAGGARRSSAAKEEWCALDVVINSWVGPLLCTDAGAREQEWATLLGVDQPADGLWPDISDPRVDAIVSIDGGAFDFGPEGLGAINVPALLFFARGAPGELPYPLDTLFDALHHDKEVVVIFEYANHALFSPLCSEGMLSAQTVGDCAQPVWDRPRSHDLFNHLATAFFLATLSDDPDAAAALAPDVARFPGITYQATGF